jgi:hypothetical protein
MNPRLIEPAGWTPSRRPATIERVISPRVAARRNRNAERSWASSYARDVERHRTSDPAAVLEVRTVVSARCPRCLIWHRSVELGKITRCRCGMLWTPVASIPEKS